jgi:hypothetical protein
MLRNLPSEVRTAMVEDLQQKLPVGHVGTPEEVAEAYIFAMKVRRLVEATSAHISDQLSTA